LSAVRPHSPPLARDFFTIDEREVSFAALATGLLDGEEVARELGPVFSEPLDFWLGVRLSITIQL
jgi:hypothetical protein